jgi:hypothetical protein
MPQAAAPIQYQPAQLAPPPDDPNKNPGVGYMGTGGKVADIASNFLNGWMRGKQQAEEKKIANASQEMQGLHYGFQIAQANAQQVQNDHKATPEQKQQAEQARQAAWKAYLDGAEKYVQPSKGGSKSGGGGKKDGGGIKGHLKQAFGAEDPHLYAQAGLGLLRKTGPPPLAQPSPQEQTAQRDYDDQKKRDDAVEAEANAFKKYTDLQTKGGSPEEISKAKKEYDNARENTRIQTERKGGMEREPKPQTAKEHYDAAYAASVERGDKDPTKDPEVMKWDGAMKAEADAQRKQGGGDKPETRDFDGYLQQYDPENKLPGEHKQGWVKLGKSKKDAEGPTEKGTWKLMKKDGKPVWQNDKTMETRDAKGFTPEGEDAKLQDKRDKYVQPRQDMIDSVESAHDYLDGKKYTGTGDYNLMLQLQQAITAGKKSGIRFTGREQDMVTKAQTAYDSMDAYVRHKFQKGGPYFSNELRKDMVDTLDGLRENADKEIKRYDKEHPNDDRPQSMDETPKSQTKYSAGDIVTGPDGKNHKVIGYNKDGTLKLDKNVEPD